MTAAYGQEGASEIREHARACIGSKATAHMYGLNPPIGLCQKGETLGARVSGRPLVRVTIECTSALHSWALARRYACLDEYDGTDTAI